jgi:hypothetical protein
MLTMILDKANLVNASTGVRRLEIIIFGVVVFEL